MDQSGGATVNFHNRTRFPLEEEPQAVTPDWCKRANLSYRSGIQYAVAHFERSSRGPAFKVPIDEGGSIASHPFLGEGRDLSLAQGQLEEALYWHGAALTLSLSTLYKRDNRVSWYTALWGARSQGALTRALLGLPRSIRRALPREGTFALEREWRFELSGAITAARVIRTLQVRKVHVYEAWPEEDAANCIDLLLVRADLPTSLALQVKGDRQRSLHECRLLDPRDPWTTRQAMERGVRALQEETHTPWIPVLCNVGVEDGAASGTVQYLPRLADAFERCFALLPANITAA